jgi:hypothetical protein
MDRRSAAVETRESLLAELSSKKLEPRLSEIVAALIARVRDMPELAGVGADRELWAAIEKSAYLNLRSGLAHLGYPLPLPTSLDPEARRLTQLWARRGLTAGALVRTYRLAHQVLWHYWFETIAAASVHTELRRELLERVSEFLFAYMDRVSGLIEEEHSRERALMFRNRDDVRLDLVHELLRGHFIDARPLGYELDRWHLAVVGSGDGVEEAIGALAERQHGLSLVLRVDGDVWGWIGSERAMPRAIEGRTRRLQLPEGSRLSFGDPAPGPDGFRRSHEQAREAHRIAHGGSPHAAVVTFDDLALEALALGDEMAARAFVARELGELGEPSNRTSTLRETLRAYFMSGQNAAAAAASLRVHEQTIAYRLRAIEEALGRPIRTRRAELEVALRLRDVLEPPRADLKRSGRRRRARGKDSVASRAASSAAVAILTAWIVPLNEFAQSL